MRLFRAVSIAERDDISSSGVLRPTLGSMEGKWFAESAMDATRWGHALYDPAPFAVVTLEVPDDVADALFRLARLDNIGPARFADVTQLVSSTIIEVANG